MAPQNTNENAEQDTKVVVVKKEGEEVPEEETQEAPQKKGGCDGLKRRCGAIAPILVLLLLMVAVVVGLISPIFLLAAGLDKPFFEGFVTHYRAEFMFQRDLSADVEVMDLPQSAWEQWPALAAMQQGIKINAAVFCVILALSFLLLLLQFARLVCNIKYRAALKHLACITTLLMLVVMLVGTALLYSATGEHMPRLKEELSLYIGTFPRCVTEDCSAEVQVVPGPVLATWAVGYLALLVLVFFVIRTWVGPKKCLRCCLCSMAPDPDDAPEEEEAQQKDEQAQQQS